MVDIGFPTYHITALPNRPRRPDYGGSLCIIHIHAHLVSTGIVCLLALGTIVDGYMFTLRVVGQQMALHTLLP